MDLLFTNVASTKSPELAHGTAGAKSLIEPIPKPCRVTNIEAAVQRSLE
jgi:hypothetical protein